MPQPISIGTIAVTDRQDLANAGIPGPLQNRVAVVIETRIVEMGMGVVSRYLEMRKFELTGDGVNAAKTIDLNIRRLVSMFTQFPSGLFQSCAVLNIFDETRQDGLVSSTDGSGHDHAVRFQSAQLPRLKIGNNHNLTADQRLRLVGHSNARQNLAFFEAQDRQRDASSLSAPLTRSASRTVATRRSTLAKSSIVICAAKTDRSGYRRFCSRRSVALRLPMSTVEFL